MPGYTLYRAFGAGRTRMRAPSIQSKELLLDRQREAPSAINGPTGLHTLHPSTFCYTRAEGSFGQIMNIRLASGRLSGEGNFFHSCLYVRLPVRPCASGAGFL